MGHETVTDKKTTPETKTTPKTNLEVIRTTFSTVNFEQVIIIERMQPLRKASVLCEILFIVHSLNSITVRSKLTKSIYSC